MLKKTVSSILIPLSIMFLLTACKTVTDDNSDNKQEIDATLNGNKIHSRSSDFSYAWMPTVNYINIDDHYTFVYNVPRENYYVKVDGEDIPLMIYIMNNEIPIVELTTLGFGQVNYSFNFIEELDINIDNYIIDKIWVRELNNEMINLEENPSGQNTSLEYISISIINIKKDIAGILTNNNSKYTTFPPNTCNVTKPPKPISIDLKSQVDDSTISLTFDQNYVDIKVYTNDEVYCLQQSSQYYGYLDNLFNTIKAVYERQND